MVGPGNCHHWPPYCFEYQHAVIYLTLRQEAPYDQRLCQYLRLKRCLGKFIGYFPTEVMGG